VQRLRRRETRAGRRDRIRGVMTFLRNCRRGPADAWAGKAMLDDNADFECTKLFLRSQCSAQPWRRLRFDQRKLCSVVRTFVAKRA
jgi:hypothetical protein